MSKFRYQTFFQRISVRAQIFKLGSSSGCSAISQTYFVLHRCDMIFRSLQLIPISRISKYWEFEKIKYLKVAGPTRSDYPGLCLRNINMKNPLCNFQKILLSLQRRGNIKEETSVGIQSGLSFESKQQRGRLLHIFEIAVLMRRSGGG